MSKILYYTKLYNLISNLIIYMSKFTQEQKNEIITLKLNGTRAKEIMEKFNVSRAYIYKMLKENDIECRSEINTEIDIYRSITREEIRETAKKYLNSNQRMILDYVPAKDKAQN